MVFQYTGMIGYTPVINLKSITDEIFGDKSTTEKTMNETKSAEPKKTKKEK